MKKNNLKKKKAAGEAEEARKMKGKGFSSPLLSSGLSALPQDHSQQLIHENDEIKPEKDEEPEMTSGEDPSEESKLNTSQRKRKYIQSQGNCALRSQQISEGRMFPEEVVWNEGRKIWREITKEDFEFIQTLQKESTLNFGIHLKKYYRIDHNLPTTLPPLCPMDYPTVYRAAPPPPRETLASFVASDSVAMMIASRGSLDEISTEKMIDKIADERIDDPIPPEEIDSILKMSWTNIREYPGKKGKITSENINHLYPTIERSLGKRGRLYNDVWNEEDFLLKYRVPLKKCLEWSDILHNYHDDHDGCYIEWLLFQLHHRKQNPLQSPPRHRQSNQAPVVHMNQSPNGHFAFSIIPPPVPVSMQHPASWGPGNRICQPPFSQRKDSELTISPVIHHANSAPEWNIKDKLRSRTSLKPSSPRPTKVNGLSSRKILTPELDQNHMIDVTQVHPACVSETILLPPGSKTSTSPSSEDPDEFDCIDEIGLLAQSAAESLTSVCARNFGCLSRLLTSVERELELARLRQTRERLLGSCQVIANIMKESRGASIQQSLFNSSQRPNSAEWTPQSSLLSMLRHSTHRISPQFGTSPRICSFSSSTTQPYQSNYPNQRLFLARPVYPKSLGSFPSTKIKLSNFIQTLTIGSKVEVRIQNLPNLWSACSVTAFKYDEAGVLRYIETCPLSGCQGICQWNAVEDENIAPPGTHLPSFLFEGNNTTFKESNI